MAISFLRRKQVYELLGQFLETGVPITSALESILQYYPDGKLNNVLRHIKTSFEERGSLALALAQVLGPLPHFEQLALESGEMQGHPGKAMASLAKFLQQKETLLKDLLENLQGPVLSLHGALGLYLFFDWYGTNGEVSVFFWIKALILLAIIWAGIYLVGHRLVKAFTTRASLSLLPLSGSLTTILHNFDIILSYRALLEAGHTRHQIHQTLLASFQNTSGEFKKSLELALDSIIQGKDAPPPPHFLSPEDWAEWGVGRKAGREGEVLQKIETRLTDNLERGFRSYFIWANRILRFAVLLLVAFLIYKMHMGRLQALEDINLGE
ncbi:MAG: type II secretion system F family protein [Bdellovibrionota bacterium]